MTATNWNRFSSERGDFPRGPGGGGGLRGFPKEWKRAHERDSFFFREKLGAAAYNFIPNLTLRPLSAQIFSPECGNNRASLRWASFGYYTHRWRFKCLLAIESRFAIYYLPIIRKIGWFIHVTPFEAFGRDEGSTIDRWPTSWSFSVIKACWINHFKIQSWLKQSHLWLLQSHLDLRKNKVSCKLMFLFSSCLTLENSSQIRNSINRNKLVSMINSIQPLALLSR